MAWNHTKFNTKYLQEKGDIVMVYVYFYGFCDDFYKFAQNRSENIFYTENFTFKFVWFKQIGVF